MGLGKATADNSRDSTDVERVNVLGWMLTVVLHMGDFMYDTTSPAGTDRGTVECLPVFLCNVSAKRQPVWGAKVDSLSTIEPGVEARMVSIGKRDDKGTLLVHQPMDRHAARLRNRTYSMKRIQSSHAYCRGWTNIATHA